MTLTIAPDLNPWPILTGIAALVVGCWLLVRSMAQGEKIAEHTGRMTMPFGPPPVPVYYDPLTSLAKSFQTLTQEYESMTANSDAVADAVTKIQADLTAYQSQNAAQAQQLATANQQVTALQAEVAQLPALQAGDASLADVLTKLKAIDALLQPAA